MLYNRVLAPMYTRNTTELEYRIKSIVNIMYLEYKIQTTKYVIEEGISPNV